MRPRATGLRGGRWRGVLVIAGLALSGCGGNGQSTLDPQNQQTRDISDLWWVMLAAGAIVFAGALAMIGISWLRRNREGLPVVGKNEKLAGALVVTFGILVPVVTLIALWAVANLSVIKTTDAPAAGTTSMNLEVIGHQWFWEVRYPGTPAVTANEIHIPARTRVNLILKTADVIHSFWVPELNRKADTVPGYPNRLLLYSAKPGVFNGQCAEFCGAQHANMRMVVDVDPPARFRAWLRDQSAARRAPGTHAQRVGEQIFTRQACSSCHTIRGTRAQGTIGPDLTHLAGRRTLAALTIPNRPDQLARWIADPQHAKPGNKMPGLQLTRPQLHALVAYLESLR